VSHAEPLVFIRHFQHSVSSEEAGSVAGDDAVPSFCNDQQ
jgi:hypothetical protein